MRSDKTIKASVAAAAIVALMSAPSVSWSQPTADAESSAKKPATKTTKTTKAKSKPLAAPVYGPTLSKSDRALIDLFPKSVLANQPQQPEKSRGISLGDDSNWKVQAAQVGAMAVGFAALVGLCGSGNCKIPNSVANALLPSFLESDNNVATPSPRRVQPIRNLR